MDIIFLTTFTIAVGLLAWHDYRKPRYTSRDFINRVLGKY
jgi:hypothetical protein